MNDRARIMMNNNFSSLVVKVRDFRNLKFTKKNCEKFIENARHIHLGKRGVKVFIEYSYRTCAIDDSFYTSMHLDDKSRLRNIFWVIAQSKATYLCF